MITDKQQWFKSALKTERWKEPGWILQLFCVSELKNINDITISLESPPQPYELFVASDNKSYCYWDNQTNEVIDISGTDVTQPLFDYKERIKLNAGDLPNVGLPIDTTYGNVLINLYCCVYAFGSKVPFFAGKLKKGGNEIKDYVISKRVKDIKNPKPDEILPAEFEQWKKAVSAMAVFAVICCPTGSRASFTIDKRVIAERDRLLKEHAHELNNNAIVADIENKLVKMDAEINKDDVSEGFFGPVPKLRGVGRKKADIIYGLEGGLGGTGGLIKDSLAEGLDFTLLPLYADTTTAASSSRGLLTAQGGELVKYNLRMFQNSLIVMEDCGSKYYLDVIVDKNDHSFLLGRRILIDGGKTITLDDINIKQYFGKPIKLRSPGTCLAGGRNFCKMCLDINLAERPDGIAIATGSTTNVIMQDAMKAMHGKVNDTMDIEPADHMS